MRGLMMNYQLTIPTILRRAESLFGDKEIVSRLPDKSIHRYTYGDFAPRVKKLADALHKLGVRRGDRVATLCWNHYQHLEAYYAIPCMGAVVHTLNLRLSGDDLSYIVNHAEDKIIIVDQVLLPLFEKFKSSVSVSKVIVIQQTGDPIDPSYLNYEDVVGSGDSSLFEPYEDDEYAAACLCYTSGTTGKPKGVLYSHRSIVLHSISFLLASNGVGVIERDVVLPVVPMFHACAWGFPFSSPFVGAKLVFPGPYLDAASLVELFESEKVTVTAGVPTVMISILNHLDTAASKPELHLRVMAVGGSAMPPFATQAFKDRYNITALATWGMTELSPLGSSEGLPIPFVEARGRNEDGIIPWDGETMGELEVRGPHVAAAYYKDNDTSKFTDDGWLRTGDIVTIDRDGRIGIKDRSKDVIKSGGEWISSVELENSLMGHPHVFEACVIAIPDPKWIERPFAYVVLREGRSVSIEELKEYLSDKFAKFWIPDGFAIVPSIPKTSVGKFLKSALRENHK